MEQNRISYEDATRPAYVLSDPPLILYPKGYKGKKYQFVLQDEISKVKQNTSTNTL